MGNIRNTYGNWKYHYPHKRFTIPNPLEGFEVDYYFMAKRFAGSDTQITLVLWVVVVDAEGFAYGLKTNHMGHYKNWKLAIEDMITYFLSKLDVDSLLVKRTVREIEIKKEGHIIPYDIRTCGDIGISGGSELHIRKEKFTYLKT